MTTRVIIMAKEPDSFAYARHNTQEGYALKSDIKVSFLDTHIWENGGWLTIWSYEEGVRIVCNEGPGRIKITSYNASQGNPIVTYIEPQQFVKLSMKRVKWTLHEEKLESTD